ncbi:hypothetical protein M23134_07174 [Microscilla marina ATCC 23134]|uniref:Uncharacterized protein n=1 Tax=Microscilla marina ATCC 23134 TaxID=313606 RepID=A1ZYZ9_MICM2|nr:hypothetical protein M23134_07174 [Microscilla marina ATCC 23134]
MLYPDVLLNFLTIAMAMLAKFASPQNKASTQKWALYFLITP